MTLKEFINIFDISDSEILYLTDNNTDKIIYQNCPHYSVKEIRKLFDIKQIEIVKVTNKHFIYETDDTYRLTIKVKETKANKKLINELKKRYEWRKSR